MGSLRTRLLTGIMGSMALLLAVFGLFIYLAIRRALLREFDRALDTTAHTLASVVMVDENELEFEFDPNKVPELQRTHLPLYVQAWLADGTTFTRWPSPDQADLPAFHGAGGRVLIRSLTLPDGRPARGAGIRFVPPIEIERRPGTTRPVTDTLTLAGERLVPSDHPPVTLVVARDITRLYTRLGFLRRFLAVGGAGTMAAALLVALVIVSRGLSPLRALAARIAAIRERDLAVRLQTARVPAEVRPVVDRLNDLLRRLEDAFDRERGFTADVAHQLRTPLSGMRATIDVALARQRQSEEYREALADCRDIVSQMQVVVEDLLMLARLDAGWTAFTRERVQVAEIVDACWQPLAPRAAERGITVVNGLSPDLACLADRDGLVMVLTNLLENAVEYADAGGRIDLSAERANGAVQLTISNTGCTLSRREAKQASERFWRGDPSRANTAAHCGLGLALVKRIVAALDGRTTIGVEPGGVFTVRIALPAG